MDDERMTSQWAAEILGASYAEFLKLAGCAPRIGDDYANAYKALSDAFQKAINVTIGRDVD